MEAAAAPIARAAAEKSVARARRTSAREQALAAAMVVRYAEPGERADLDRKYVEAMQGVAKSFPDDPDIATIAAKSLMLLSPWDYWVDSGRAFLGIDHSAISVADTSQSIDFYQRLGLQRSGRSCNTGPAQDRLDGIEGAIVEVTDLAPVEVPPHVELRSSGLRRELRPFTKCCSGQPAPYR